MKPIKSSRRRSWRREFKKYGSVSVMYGNGWDLRRHEDGECYVHRDGHCPIPLADKLKMAK